MKYCLTILLLVSIHKIGYCQYQPMLGKNSKWYEFFEMFAGDAHNYTYTCTEDSVINDIAYRKILYSHDKGGVLYYFLREDTVNKTVYLLDNSSSNQGETLLYDYSIEVGDTFTCSSCYPTSIILDSIITTVDTSREDLMIFLATNHPRIFYFHNPDTLNYPGFVTWIEGIGSLSGLLESNHSWNRMGGSTLICHYDSLGRRNFEFISATRGGTDCKIHSGLKMIHEQYSVELGPNPFSTFLNINFTGPKTVDMVIQNNLGEVLFEKREIQTKASINLESLPDGIYIVTLSSSSNKQLSHYKILKNTNY